MNGCDSRTEAPFEIVSVRGEVDLSWSADVRKEVLEALDRSNQVLVELDQVTYMDSSGIAALVEGYQSAKSRDIRFGLLQISEPVRSVLELARLDQVFPIYADLDAARD